MEIEDERNGESSGLEEVTDLNNGNQYTANKFKQGETGARFPDSAYPGMGYRVGNRCGATPDSHESELSGQQIWRGGGSRGGRQSNVSNEDTAMR